MNQLEHVCRICLVGADILQSIEGTKLQDTFEMLSQTQLIGRDLTKSVCNTCRSLLRKCQRLKQFVQESESWLKLMLLYGTTADTVAEQVVNRKPHNLQRIKTVVLSISATVNLPVTQVKTEVTEAEDIVKELVLSKKDEVSVENDIEPTEEPQVVMKVDVELQRDDESGGKEEVEVKIGNIKVLENEESSTENEVTDCENEEIAIIKDQIAMLKEEIAKEIEQKVRKKDKNAVENEEVLIKEELIEQGEGSEEELGKVSVKEEMEVEDDRIPECIKREPTETNNSEDGLVNVSSSTLLNELQRVLRQNSGLLPEIKGTYSGLTYLLWSRLRIEPTSPPMGVVSSKETPTLCQSAC